jgi:hypothetical protein
MAESTDNQNPKALGPEDTAASDMALSFPTIGEPEPEPEAPKASPEEIEARLAAKFEEKFSTERQLQQQTIDRILQSQQSVVDAFRQREEPRPQPVSFDDLPDPVEDRVGFNKALAERVAALSKQQAEELVSRSTAETTRATSLDAVWNKFQAEYKDLASDPELAGAFATAEIQRIRATGADPINAIISDPDGFNKRVADRMRQKLAAPAAPPKSRAEDVGVGSPAPKGGSPTTSAKPFLQQMKERMTQDNLI